jgi:hypothetical protein
MAAPTTVPRPRKTPPKTAPKSTGTTEPTDTGVSGGSGGDTPPRARTAPPREAPPKAPRRPTARSLEGRLAEFLSMAALPFALQGDDYCAQIIAQRTPDLAKSLAALAEENASIKRTLNRMLEGSAWGGVALSVTAIVVPIAQHHGLVPGGDPFAFQYPNSPQRSPQGIPSPAAGFGGWSPPPTDDTSTMGAPASPDSNGTPEDAGWTRTPGAPPGVVTVAATTAGHDGSR